MAGVLEGKPLVFTSGLAGVMRGSVTEHDKPAAHAPVFQRGRAVAGCRRRDRAANEAFGLALAPRGVRVSSMRLPPSVHGDGDHGFVPMLIDIARKTKASGFIGDGANKWPAVHRLDAARLFRIALVSVRATAPG